MKLIDVSTKSHPHMFAMVDDDDFDRINVWKWSVEVRRNTSYAIRCVRRNGKKTTIRMHVEIMGRSSPDIDHRDGNGLNNQRDNLRRATDAQNQWNVTKRGGKTSTFKGVSWCYTFGRWKSHISAEGRRTFLGSYPTEELAAAAYNHAARRLHGEFAVLNDTVSISEEFVTANRMRSSRWKNRSGDAS